MRASEIMTRPVFTVQVADPVRKAAGLIARHQVGGVPVLDSEGRLAGIVSEKDILRAIYPTYAELLDDPVGSRDFEEMESRYTDVSRLAVSEIMTANVITVRPETAILEAASLMIRRGIRRVPVVDRDGRLVGIVSQGDIHQAVFGQHFG
ncbi:MAG: hypothetical protein A3G97_03035 [Candidatus Rokubacteria bacterium RIFCSPLOWO2_12_FULL_69_21]|nr:MAG: hypothetical protein A3G97_03035 [Candidatus Rokubacteria bacterium RIFCSPLOWO2_12_FULL_69_21]